MIASVGSFRFGTALFLDKEKRFCGSAKSRDPSWCLLGSVTGTVACALQAFAACHSRARRLPQGACRRGGPRRPGCRCPQVMFEDATQNRLLESLDLYEQVVSNPIFR